MWLIFDKFKNSLKYIFILSFHLFIFLKFIQPVNQSSPTFLIKKARPVI